MNNINTISASHDNRVQEILTGELQFSALDIAFQRALSQSVLNPIATCVTLKAQLLPATIIHEAFLLCNKQQVPLKNTALNQVLAALDTAKAQIVSCQLTVSFFF